ncbi:hypothetical protein N4G70_26250 [Streptomyces sp. ASQP_92]|uniref:hypothetical protein n=1 Tax=Streptomyces sp. ASQP_92 TaxID=2979116 RepID=UPI0021BF6153|nr:hypothetical protein [Streptomyces sp. ASQP_92]MCT9092348.1 hypothetical protein [Streptomyces sp. ASQP_92]
MRVVRRKLDHAIAPVRAVVRASLGPGIRAGKPGRDGAWTPSPLTGPPVGGHGRPHAREVLRAREASRTRSAPAEGAHPSVPRATRADAGVTGLTNGGVQTADPGEAHDKPVYRTRIDFYCGLALFGGKAAARLTNVLAS